MAGRLQGKVVLITGIGGGQGRAASSLFTAEGAAVVGCDLDQASCAETVELVRAARGTIVGMAPVDLGDPEQCRGWIEEASAVHGRIDVLYNNASAARFGPLADLSVDDWRFTVRNELDLVFYATKFAWPHLARQGGAVINTASIAGWRGADTPMVPHAATKAGVIGMTRQLAVEGAPLGIRAISISPGPIETPGTAAMFADPAVRAHIAGQTLVGRPGAAEEVARLALFLASDEASYVTGADFVVDGGQLAR
jgi:meso-butanediol dehydrogenase / (S,S)-butanediol dehydrogenase / diacetyl reductase